MDKIEKFTDRAHRVMALADQEARRFHHEYLGTEHLLLGLLAEGAGVGAAVLKNLGVDLSKVRVEVETVVGRGPSTSAVADLPQTPRVRKVIESAGEEARSLNHSCVGAEHLLLGLVREREGVAGQVLMNLGVELEQTRKEVLNLLTAVPDGAESAALEVRCPNCRTFLTARADLVGSQVGCKRCGRVFRLDVAFLEPASPEPEVLVIRDEAAERRAGSTRPTTLPLPVRRRTGPVCCTGVSGLLGGVLVLALLGSVLLPVWWAVHGKGRCSGRHEPYYRDAEAAAPGAPDLDRFAPAALRQVPAVEHTEPVVGVAFTVDGAILATAAGDTVGLARLSDAAAAVLESRVVPDAALQAVAYAPDGRLLAAGIGEVGSRRRGVVDSISPAGVRIRLCADLEPISALAVAPDGRTFAAAGASGIALHGTDDGALIARLDGRQGAVGSLAFFADGRRLLSGSADGTVCLWDAVERRLMRTLGSHAPSAVAGVAVSPDGLQAASVDGRGRLLLWSVDEGRERLELDAKGSARCAAFSPDGRFLAVGDGEGVLRVWHVGTGTCSVSAAAHEGAVLCLSFSSDGRRLATGGADKVARVWTPQFSDMNVRLSPPR